jgi:hypothetical protein
MHIRGILAFHRLRSAKDAFDPCDRMAYISEPKFVACKAAQKANLAQTLCCDEVKSAIAALLNTNEVDRSLAIQAQLHNCGVSRLLSTNLAFSKNFVLI